MKFNILKFNYRKYNFKDFILIKIKKDFIFFFEYIKNRKKRFCFLIILILFFLYIDYSIVFFGLIHIILKLLLVYFIYLSLYIILFFIDNYLFPENVSIRETYNYLYNKYKIYNNIQLRVDKIINKSFMKHKIYLELEGIIKRVVKWIILSFKRIIFITQNDYAMLFSIIRYKYRLYAHSRIPIFFQDLVLKISNFFNLIFNFRSTLKWIFKKIYSYYRRKWLKFSFKYGKYIKYIIHILYYPIDLYRFVLKNNWKILFKYYFSKYYLKKNINKIINNIKWGYLVKLKPFIILLMALLVFYFYIASLNLICIIFLVFFYLWRYRYIILIKIKQNKILIFSLLYFFYFFFILFLFSILLLINEFMFFLV